ncbi:MAG: hypothetical protein P8Y83_11765, partial [Gammaproteobacteria bacterium]
MGKQKKEGCRGAPAALKLKTSRSDTETVACRIEEDVHVAQILGKTASFPISIGLMACQIATKSLRACSV